MNEIIDRKPRTVPEIIEVLAESIGRLPDISGKYVCTVKQYRKGRSLDANAYYWAMLGKYADWARESKVAMHNQMLARYGQPMDVDGMIVYVELPDTVPYLEHSDVHLRPTSEVHEDEDGIEKRTFMLLRGSHTYDSMEMAILIDGLISEIQGSAAPIDTLTPDELKKLRGYGYEV